MRRFYGFGDFEGFIGYVGGFVGTSNRGEKLN